MHSGGSQKPPLEHKLSRSIAESKSSRPPFDRKTSTASRRSLLDKDVWAPSLALLQVGLVVTKYHGSNKTSWGMGQRLLKISKDKHYLSWAHLKRSAAQSVEKPDSTSEFSLSACSALATQPF